MSNVVVAAIGDHSLTNVLLPQYHRTASKPVGILGLGPENEDSYVESDKRFGSPVTASGPTPFAIKLRSEEHTSELQSLGESRMPSSA